MNKPLCQMNLKELLEYLSSVGEGKVTPTDFDLLFEVVPDQGSDSQVSVDPYTLRLALKTHGISRVSCN